MNGAGNPGPRALVFLVILLITRPCKCGGAHSTRRGVRWKNRAGTEEYISTVTGGGQLATERRVLTDAERLEEALFMGLRLSDGIDVQEMKNRYGVDVWAEYGRELQPFVDGGLLVYDDRSLRVLRQGMLLAHEVMAVFIRSTVR